MQIVQLRKQLPDQAVARMLGNRPVENDWSLLVTGDRTRIYKPNGKLLAVYRRGAVSTASLEAAWPSLYSLRTQKTGNRGMYAGRVDGAKNTIRFRIKKDGTQSRTHDAVAPPVRSAVIGYFDRYERIPYCRATSFTSREPEAWGDCLPFIREVAAAFREEVPERYAAQEAMAKKTHPAFVIAGTPFTTLTVNNTVAGAYHTDRGDYAEGFGVIVVLRKGQYRGGELVFPKFGVAADLQHGDVLFCDVHEVHGVREFFEGVGEENEDWMRISVVMYYREKMIECLSPAEELERAKMVHNGAIETADDDEDETGGVT